MREEPRRILDEATRQRRQRKALESLDRDNHLDEPQNELKLSRNLPKFEEDLNGSGSGSMIGAGGSAKKKRRGKSSVGAKLRMRKTLQILLEEEHILMTSGNNSSGEEANERGSYFQAQIPPSLLPARRFCAVCGFEGPYTCVQCGARYCSVKCGETHKDTRCLKWTE